jgi:hypothetical protein
MSDEHEDPDADAAETVDQLSNTKARSVVAIAGPGVPAVFFSAAGRLSPDLPLARSFAR